MLVTGSFWWDLLISIAAALLLAWLALVIALALVRPRGSTLAEALRLLPDVLRLIRRLAADKIPLAGTILNDWNPRSDHSAYSSYLVPEAETETVAQ